MEVVYHLGVGGGVKLILNYDRDRNRAPIFYVLIAKGHAYIFHRNDKIVFIQLQRGSKVEGIGRL